MAAEPYVLSGERVGAFGHVRALTPAMAGFAAAVGVAFVNGGYFPTSWGFLTVGAAAIAAVVLARGRFSMSRADTLWIGALTVLVAWTALSTLWTRGVPGTVLARERTLAYAVVGLALVLIVRRE